MPIDLMTFKYVEPKKSNRFLIKLEGSDVHEYLFKNYHFYNEGDKLFFETKFYETVNYTFNPKDFFSIIGVSLTHLDPTGSEIVVITFNIKTSIFNQKGDYAIDDRLMTEFKFEVDINTIKITYKDGGN